MAAETPQLMTLSASGLITYPNQFSAPDGGMVVAQNIFIDRKNVVETARGLGSSLSGGNYNTDVYALTTVNYMMIGASGTTVAPVDPSATGGQNLYSTDQNLAAAQLAGFYYLLGTGFVGSQAAKCVNQKLDCFTTKGNVYVTTAGGVVRLPGSGTPANSFNNYGAGMPKPLAPEFTYAISGTGILPLNTAYRYRTTYVRIDTQGNRLTSPPSEPVIVYGDNVNTYSITLRQALPGKQMQPGDIIQVWRSLGLAFPVGGATNTDPGDELQLSTEHVITNAEINAAVPNFVSVLDSTFDTSLGAYLYTNQNTGDGINAAEYAPPLSNCATGFKNIALYANTRQPPSIAFRLLTGSGWGAPPYVFTLSNGTTNYVATSAAIAPPVNYVQTTPGNGTFSDGFDARRAISLATVLSNNNFDVQLYYVGRSVSNAAVGAIQNLPFTTTNTGPTAANAQYTILMTTLGVGDRENGTWTLSAGGNVPVQAFAPNLPLTAVSDLGPNRLYFSKPNQPEAVPLLNYVEVGGKSQSILAVTPLRNSVFVWRRDGLFRVTGTTAQDITVELFDETVKLTHENSVRRAGNILFAATTRGIVEVTEAGARLITADIEDIILKQCTDLATYPICASAASDIEHKYIFMPVTGGSTTAYVWNFKDRLWSTIVFSGAQASPNALAGGTVGVTGGTNPRFVDRIWVGLANGSISAPKDLIPITGSVTYDKVPTITYVVVDGNNPGAKKRFTECSLILQGSTVTSLQVSFSSETTPTPEVVTIANLVNPFVARTVVPRSCQYASQLTLTITAPTVGEYLKLSGVSLGVEVTSLRTTR